MSSIRSVMKNYMQIAEVERYLSTELNDSGYGGSDIQKTPVGLKITIFSNKPGMIIGRRGLGIKALTSNLDEKYSFQNTQISVLEIEKPELNPRLMCNKIAASVTRGIAFRRAAIWTLKDIMNAGALGAEIVISGKLRSDRSNHEKHVAGVVPKSGETAERVVIRAITHVQLKMGLYGINIKIAIKNSIRPEVIFNENKDDKPSIIPSETSDSSSDSETVSEIDDNSDKKIEEVSINAAVEDKGTKIDEDKGSK